MTRRGVVNSRRRRYGLALAGLLGLADVVLPFLSLGSPAEGEVAQPAWITYLGIALGVVTLVAVVVVWRSGLTAAVWVLIITRVLSAVQGVPAFIFGAPLVWQMFVGGWIVLTVVAVIMVWPGSRSQSVQAA